MGHLMAHRPPRPVVIEADHVRVPYNSNATRGTAQPAGWFVVDLADLGVVEGRRWFLSGGYPATRIDGRLRRLHRLLLDSGRKQVDHFDGDRLNNRRSNLRLVTLAQNRQNVVQAPGASGHRNVYPRRDGYSGWMVRVKHRGREHHGGFFAKLEDAAEAARALRERVFTHHNEARH